MESRSTGAETVGAAVGARPSVGEIPAASERGEAVSVARALEGAVAAVVVEVHPVGAQFGQLVHQTHRIERGSGLEAERVATGVAHRPEAEGEAVIRAGRVSVHRPQP